MRGANHADIDLSATGSIELTVVIDGEDNDTSIVGTTVTLGAGNDVIYTYLRHGDLVIRDNGGDNDTFLFGTSGISYAESALNPCLSIYIDTTVSGSHSIYVARPTKYDALTWDDPRQSPNVVEFANISTGSTAAESDMIEYLQFTDGTRINLKALYEEYDDQSYEGAVSFSDFIEFDADVPTSEAHG